ncbi:MAG: RNA-binding cell elongation regulator Jag/EloR [Halanaerobiaceae bacterium]
MDRVRQEGKTVEQAIEKGLQKLDISRDDAEINVVEEGTGGLFGLFGGSRAIVEIKKKKDPIRIGEKFLNDVFSATSLEVQVSVVEEKTSNEQVMYNLNSPDLGIVIGHRGETLDALQYLTSLVVNRNVDQYFRVLLDAEGYRDRRKETLIRLANKLTRKAIKKGRKVVLEPMPPHERRIIHIAVKENPRVKSHSEGEEPFRKVIIEKVD